MDKGIVIDHVSMTYSGIAGSVEALRDVNLVIIPGEFICLVGPSGCGKTMLLNIIAGFLKPTSGSIRMDGRPITGPRGRFPAICGFPLDDGAPERPVRS